MSEQRARTVRVVNLLDESFTARQAGDVARSGELLDAALDLDPMCVSGIRGGMIIGQIPNPETDYPGWTDWVAAVINETED